MDGQGPLSADEAFQKLKAYHADHGKDINIHQLFLQDPQRFEKFQ